MKSAETATCRNGRLADKRHDLFDDVTIITFLPRRTPNFVAVNVRPSFNVNRVDAKKFNLSAVNETRQRVNHAEILEVVAHGVLRRENQKRNAAFSVSLDRHIPPQIFAEPTNIFRLQINTSLRVDFEKLL